MLDQNKQILEQYFLSWLAWPLVKQRLWLSITKDKHHSMLASKRYIKISWNVLRGCLEYLLSLVSLKKYNLVVCRSQATIRQDNEGNYIDTITSISAAIDKNHVNVIYDWCQENVNLKTTQSSLHESRIGSFFLLLSFVVQYRKKIQSIAKSISGEVQKMMPELPNTHCFKICRRALAIFQLKYYFYHRYFKQHSVAHLFMEDADGKVAEVAAAKRLNIPVFEMQHGAFGPLDIDYSWQPAHLSIRSAMPVVDHIFVYGEIWRRMILSNGFWSNDQVHVIGHATIDHYRQLLKFDAPIAKYDKTSEKLNSMACGNENSHNRGIDAPVNILFVTQGILNQDVIAFLGNLLQYQQQHNDRLFNVLIKPHPSESYFMSKYDVLSNEYPSCHVLPVNSDPYKLIASSDFVMGYSSMMLIDAIGLGVPSITIKDEKCQQGLLQEYSLNDYKDVIIECHDIKDVYEKIRYLSHPTRYSHLVDSISHVSTQFFSNKKATNSMLTNFFLGRLNHKS